MRQLDSRLLPALVASLLLMTSLTAHSAVDSARQAVQNAEALVARKDYSGAARLLSAVDCREDSACLTLADFTYGWIYASWADAEPERGAALRRRALVYYQKARERNPTNVQILYNLARTARRAGEPKTAIGALQAAIELDPKQSGQNYLVIGDIHAAAGEGGSAIEAYRAATRASPDLAAAQLRLIEAYRRESAYQPLWRHSREIVFSHPELAVAGFRYCIHLSYERDPKAADDALIFWTALRSDLGALDAADLARLPGPDRWQSGLAAELRAVVSGQEPPGRVAITDWLRTDTGRDAIARTLRRKAETVRRSVERVDVSAEERQAGLRRAIDYLALAVKSAPDYQAYLYSELTGFSNAKLDAAADLVALHHALKSGAEPAELGVVSQDELEDMTQTLFGGKAGAYAAGQLKDIQRYHTVLGTIYYETGRDTSDWADNATFQLEHALKTADKIAESNPADYRPLPELKEKLAEVYRRTGNRRGAAQQALQAAMAYLETDDLAAATKSLEVARENGASAGQADAVGSVLASRQAVAGGDATLLAIDPVTTQYRYQTDIGWLKTGENLGLPRDFMAGQRFKLLADLGTVASERGDSETSEQLSVKALEAAQQQRTLTSLKDVRRLQAIGKDIEAAPIKLTNIRGPDAGGAAQTATGVADLKRWTLSSTQQAVTLQVDPAKLKEKTAELKLREQR